MVWTGTRDTVDVELLSTLSKFPTLSSRSVSHVGRADRSCRLFGVANCGRFPTILLPSKLTETQDQVTEHIIPGFFFNQMANNRLRFRRPRQKHHRPPLTLLRSGLR